MKTATARAPGRVELLGNHTDYNEGYVLSAAINYAISVRGSAQADGAIELRSCQSTSVVDSSLHDLKRREGAESWANYPLGVLHVLQEEGFALEGLAAEFASDLPTGAGLSSSAALEVATGRLAMKLFGLELDPLTLAKLCRRAENDFVGVKCGLLDQVSSVFGKRGHAVYLDCRSETVENIPLPPGVALLVFHGGVAHQLVGGEYNERREQCFAAAAALGAPALRDVSLDRLEAGRAKLDPLVYRRALHVVGENARVLEGIEHLRSGDGKEFGALMFASHESSRVNFENSTPELDALVDLAHEEPGVLGSRLTGGGFGGATISLVEQERADEVAQNLSNKYTAHTGNQGHPYLCESADGAE